MSVDDAQEPSADVPAEEALEALTQEDLDKAAGAAEPDLTSPLPGDPAAGTPVESLESLSEEAAPNEPDQPPADETPDPELGEPEGQQPPEGIVVPASGDIYDKLVEIWKGKGSPQQFDFQGSRWAVYTDGDGQKFVRTGGSGSMDSLYNSLSIG